MTTTDNSGQGQRQRTRNGRGRYIRSDETAENDAQACRLRVAGATYAQIAQTLGYIDPSTARKAVERALLATVTEPAAELRTLELARLDEALRATWEVLRAPHVVVSNGRVVLDPATGQPLRDDGPVLAAVDRVVKIGERRAKLLGLDAPVKVDAVTIDQIDAEIARLAAALSGSDEQEVTR